MEFIGREAEKKRFKRLFSQDGQGVALVYGRRRVGKSELIKQLENVEDALFDYSMYLAEGIYGRH